VVNDAGELIGTASPTSIDATGKGCRSSLAGGAMGSTLIALLRSRI